ncbi:MAG: DUF5996 family protein [Cyclobacteriaceae bacterium]
MQQIDWRHFESLEFPNEELNLAKEQAHQAVQPVSAVARKFLPEVPNDANATLAWVPGFTRLAGHWVTGVRSFRASFSFLDFNIYLVDEKVNTISQIQLLGKSQNQLLIWLEEQIGKLELDASGLTMNLPYDLPDYDSKGTSVFSAEQQMVLELSKYYHNTYVVLKEVCKSMGLEDFTIQIWPHHFDLAVSIIVKDTGDPETDSTVSLGMSPGDEELNEPYFYVNTWPHVKTTDLPKLASGAKWHEESWTGAVLAASQVVNQPDQKEIVSRFFETVSEILIAELKS